MYPARVSPPPLVNRTAAKQEWSRRENLNSAAGSSSNSTQRIVCFCNCASDSRVSVCRVSGKTNADTSIGLLRLLQRTQPAARRVTLRNCKNKRVSLRRRQQLLFVPWRRARRHASKPALTQRFRRRRYCPIHPARTCTHDTNQSARNHAASRRERTASSTSPLLLAPLSSSAADVHSATS